MISRGDYIVIQGYMAGKLGLKGFDLLVYAIIKGFCYESQGFCGNVDYIAEWTGLSIEEIQAVFQRLFERKLISRCINQFNDETVVEIIANE